MWHAPVLFLALAAIACEPALTPIERAARDRGECMVVAIDQSGFGPITATGHLSATITDAEGVFVLAGACTAS